MAGCDSGCCGCDASCSGCGWPITVSCEGWGNRRRCCREPRCWRHISSSCRCIASCQFAVPVAEPCAQHRLEWLSSAIRQHEAYQNLLDLQHTREQLRDTHGITRGSLSTQLRFLSAGFLTFRGGAWSFSCFQFTYLSTAARILCAVAWEFYVGKCHR